MFLLIYGFSKEIFHKYKIIMIYCPMKTCSFIIKI